MEDTTVLCCRAVVLCAASHGPQLPIEWTQREWAVESAVGDCETDGGNERRQHADCCDCPPSTLLPHIPITLITSSTALLHPPRVCRAVW